MNCRKRMNFNVVDYWVDMIYDMILYSFTHFSMTLVGENSTDFVVSVEEKLVSVILTLVYIVLTASTRWIMGNSIGGFTTSP